MRAWLYLEPSEFYWNNYTPFPPILKSTVSCNDSFLKWKKINPTNFLKNQLSNRKEMDYHWLHPAWVRDDGWLQSWHWSLGASLLRTCMAYHEATHSENACIQNKFHTLQSIRALQLFFYSYNFGLNVPKFKHYYPL